MIKSSVHEGRDWKPSKSDDEYNAEMLADYFDAFEAVAEKTGHTTGELRAAIAVRKTEEGSPWS
ncbi:hypothetical protein [Streptomyces sp. NPDC057257]|uniref:hypothetical protein n=1 Tax=Streptomyces sp. NPDC057257 TaxID=3346071 RepID=UPI00363B95AC